MEISPELRPVVKKQKTVMASPSTALALVSAMAQGDSSDASGNAQAQAELVYREQIRVTLEVNPLYLRHLRDRKELGYQRPFGKKKLELLTYELDITELRRCFYQCLRVALLSRYYTHVTRRQAEIDAECTEIATLTADICMSALYAKLRNIHKSYGKYGNRYSTAPCYSKEVEIPLPFALAIQDFGSFETHSLLTNHVLAPNYPEGIQNEGRRKTTYCLTEYQSYTPTLKELGIPLKAVDTRIKLGSAWWTYKIENVHDTTDLVCTLPPSHYSDLSAIIRTVLAVPEGDTASKAFVKLPEDIADYGTQIREMKPGSCVRSFLALCHGPEEEWSFGAN